MTKPVDWVSRIKSGKFISPFSYTYPEKVMDRKLTKCSAYVPGSKKLATNK